MSQQLDSRNEYTVSISTVLVSLVHIVVVGLLSLSNEKQSMSGLPERSLLTAAMQNEQSGTLRWSECPQNKFQQKRQVKGAVRKVENTKLSCGETQRTGVAQKLFSIPKRNDGLFID